MNTVRWGLLSTANINRRVIPAIRSSQRGQLVAVASRSIDSARAYAAKWEIPTIFGSYEAMLASNDIDAVYISLPNHLHAAWSIKAMQAGKHVLCEKPFAISLIEVDNMIAASREYNRSLAEAFMYRHHPQTKIVGEWAKSGRLGELCSVRGVFNFSLSSRTNVRLVPEYGGGSLWDVGVYPLSYAQFIFNSAPIFVNGAQWIGDSGIDETFMGQMVYEGDRIAQFMSSFRSSFYSSFEVIGTIGRLVSNRPFIGMDQDRKLTFYPDQGDPQEIPVPEVELYSGEFEDMHAAILDGNHNYISLSESRNHIRTALALYESARIHQTIRVD
jgi:D-xylose 1-dehydrogenase (NADP+, D-xylono-1,5-lactone-forming)